MIKTPHCISIYVYIYMVGGLEHSFYFPQYMGCHPSHWRTHIFQDGYCTTNYIYMCTYICITYINIDCFMMIYLLNIVIFHNYICINSCISILWSKTKTCLHYFTLNIWSRGLASGSSRLVLDGKFPWTWGTKTEQLIIYIYMYICIYI